MRKSGYRPRDFYENNPELHTVINMIATGVFSRESPQLFLPLVDSLLNRDDYMVLADYESYVRCQDMAGKQFLDADQWHRMSILNVARMGGFSSDRAISEYCRDIWNVGPVDVSI
jgi:starch phosphorylase